MIQIYGSPKTSAGRCYWTLEELGLSYERVEISFREREHKGPAFLKLNPNGKVPVLIDGDFTMWESIAINRYLAEKYGPHLIGEGVEARALVDMWSSWAMIDLQVPVIALFIQLVFVPEERRSEEKMTAAREKTLPLMALLDAHLADRQHMVGATFTLADLNVASVVTLLPRLGFDLATVPNLAAWLERTTARPAHTRVAAMD